ncbi:hypothetical protein PsorP6_002267 [Peronosclerospora sorghi]|uniref:Uncharacterized protein n=1 Tax=Peronosclerospora sorghi TaxID=230839 RepID=A0ACC0WUS9_9STRA|nr:hypothetical protein PsorP6_002267 [Peronosclerospora sorghi]
MAKNLCRELQQLSPVQVRELLSASGHGELLRQDEKEYTKNEAALATEANAQLAANAKNEGNAFFRQGLMDDAIAAYTRCLNLDPNNAVCLSNRAAAYLKLKQFDRAVADCSKAVGANPTIKPFMRRATAFIAKEQFGQAVADLEAALVFEPRNKECHAKLQAIVDTATNRAQDSIISADLRQAAVRGAVILSCREGWMKSVVRGNPGPAAVNGHTLFRGANGRIYLFGGRAVREQKPDVFVLDQNDPSSWDVVPTRGISAPTSRAWHSTASIGHVEKDLFCVYGGVSSHGEDSLVHLLVPTSPREFQWVKPCCAQDHNEIPAPRSGHAAVSLMEDNEDRVVFLFGGRTKQGVNNQLLILRCSSLPDAAISKTFNAAEIEVNWDEICPNGEAKSVEEDSNWPSARDGHSMCLLQSSKYHPPRLIVFGGNGQHNNERMNDVWLFDVKKQIWTLLECFGDVPSPRSYHTAHIIGDFLFVVGGRTNDSEDGNVYMLDIETREWYKVPVPSDRALTPRAWHSSVLTDDSMLYVMGGGTYHGPLKDAATLDLGYFRTKASSFS